MRQLMMAFVTLASLGFIATSSANASARWSCEGAEYVCGSSPSRAAAYEDQEAPAKRATRSAKSRRGSEDTASVSYDDEKPARRQRSRQSSDDNGGGASYSGMASYYWEPQALASGGRFNPNALTAAHKTLPFGTRVLVTNQRNGQSVEVVINDRGPYVGGRIIDLSKAAAHAINMQNSGVAPVSLRVLGRG